MPKEKVTLTLDADKLRDLRALVGARSLSSGVNAAIGAYVARLRHLAAVDEWLVELEQKHGPVPAETQQWAARRVESWDAQRKAARRRAG